MRFCPNCNSAVYDDRAALCPECGKPMNQNVCPSCGRPLAPGQRCPHCTDCSAHGGSRRTAEKTPGAPLSMWSYMGLILLASVPLVGLVFMIVWACGVGGNIHLTRFARGALLAKAVLILVGILLFAVMVSQLMPLMEDLENWAYQYGSGYYGDYYDDYYDGYYDYYDEFGGDWPDWSGGEEPPMDTVPSLSYCA